MLSKPAIVTVTRVKFSGSRVGIQGKLTHVDAKLDQGVRCITTGICPNLFTLENLHHEGRTICVCHPRLCCQRTAQIVNTLNFSNI